jgi:hypothetical protein
MSKTYSARWFNRRQKKAGGDIATAGERRKQGVLARLREWWARAAGRKADAKARRAAS